MERPGWQGILCANLRRAELVCALHDLGCGSDTSLAQIAGHMLGLRASDIAIVPADTDTCPYDLGTRASRMTYICGEAIRRAGAALAATIRAEASLELNAAPCELQLEAGIVRRRDGVELMLSVSLR